jgi:lysyl endopeptidase
MFRKSKIHLVTTIAVAATFAAINASANVAMAANVEGSQQGRVGIDFVESYTPSNTESQYESPIKPYDEATAVRPKAITLAAMPPQELAKKTAASNIGGLDIVSVPREVADTNTVAKTASFMQWITSAQGSTVGSIRIKSTDAKGVLIGVVVEQLPKEAMLRFHGNKSSTAFHISAAEILSRIQTNINAGDNTEFGRTYWAPPLDNDDVTMEIELPAGIRTDTVQISIPLISHVFTAAAELAVKALNQAKTGAGTCSVDATCYPEYDNESRSVAKISFIVSPGLGGICTGTLLNNKLFDGTPYFLTAHHCINEQTRATNIYQIDWLYRTSACDSGTQSAPVYQTSGGAVLLYTDMQTDTSFLKLNSPPPSVARFAGWSVDPVTVGGAVLGLHNPLGNLQEASLGTIRELVTCNVTSLVSVGNCVAATFATANHIRTTWSVGSSASGASGSGLFVTKNNARYLVGQLHGGFACTGPFSPTDNIYGSLYPAYRAALYRWLSPVELILRNGFE